MSHFSTLCTSWCFVIRWQFLPDHSMANWPFLCVLCPIQIKHNLWWIFPWTLLLPFFSLSVYVSFFSISFVFIIYLDSCSSLFVSWRLPYAGFILFGIHFGVSKCVSLYFSLSQPTLSYTMAIGLFLSHIS